MGKNQSKIIEGLECKDWKYIECKEPDKVKYLALWVKQYGFDGKLQIQKLEKLITDIEKQCKNNSDKMKKKQGIDEARFWLSEAHKRKEGERRSKESVKNKEVMYQRKEDDEEVVRRRRVQEQQEQEESEEGATGGRQVDLSKEKETEESKLYPHLPPAYESRPVTLKHTRSKGPVGEWSTKIGGLLSPTPSAPPTMNESCYDQYPMIEVVNPNAGDNDPQTTLVYRTWTQDDVKKAVEGIPHPREDWTAFETAIGDLRRSYHLNGTETQQVWMTMLGPDWHYVRGDWNPKDGNNVLAHNSDLLDQRVNALMQRARQRYRRRANYTEIGRTQQKEDEPFEQYKIRMEMVFKTHSGLEEDGADDGPYRQQLKNALHAGSHEPIKQWLQRHYINLQAGTLEEYVTHALHAEKVIKAKKGAKAKSTHAETFFGEEEVYWQGKGRGGFRGRGQRGRGGFRGRGQSRGPQINPRGCWSCGQEGHLARDCPNKRA